MRHVMFGDSITNYFGSRGKGTASGIQIAVADDNVRIYPVTEEGLGTGSTMIEIPRKALPNIIHQLDQIVHERDDLDVEEVPEFVQKLVWTARHEDRRLTEYPLCGLMPTWVAVEAIDGITKKMEEDRNEILEMECGYPGEFEDRMDGLKHLQMMISQIERYMMGSTLIEVETRELEENATEREKVLQDRIGRQ